MTDETPRHDLPEITAAAMLDERRLHARVRAAERAAALEAISPACARPIRGKKTCGHKLNRHDPCSLCECSGFVSEDGEDARATSDALIAANPDLYPQNKGPLDVVMESLEKRDA